MKKIKFLLLAAFTLVSVAAWAHDKTDTVKVYGNCEMCKERIEKAAQIEGVKKAEWNMDTKMLVVTYDGHKLKLEDIEKSIAAVGHDTEKFSAETSVYKKLPGCCKYERKPEGKKAASKPVSNGLEGHHH